MSSFSQQARLHVHIIYGRHYDPSLAPAKKTTVFIGTGYVGLPAANAGKTGSKVATNSAVKGPGCAIQFMA